MPTVLDVGQCDMDHGSIRRVLQQIGAKVIRAHTEEEALQRMQEESVDLVLVNRIFDANGFEGMKFIGRVTKQPNHPKVMLVSNYPESQAEAVKLGAEPGFGKQALHTAADLLRGVLKV